MALLQNISKGFWEDESWREKCTCILPLGVNFFYFHRKNPFSMNATLKSLDVFLIKILKYMQPVVELSPLRHSEKNVEIKNQKYIEKLCPRSSGFDRFLVSILMFHISHPQNNILELLLSNKKVITVARLLKSNTCLGLFNYNTNLLIFLASISIAMNDCVHVHTQSEYDLSSIINDFCNRWIF